ncbi:MAG TPA: Gfo/Idh/MocA family oxidoreductase [Thermomicrobiales bacterium]|nr:Gfo/Idh/MocA family oxidoreductase [Thermomicrobiales bacterium]
MKLIHVGLGNWGLDWERNALPWVRETVERVAIVDADEATLAKAQRTLELPDAMCFATLDEALEATDAELVLITAPLVAHVPVAIQAMEAGRHVLVEKPFAASLDDAQRAVAVADRTGRTLMVSQNYRFYPAPRTAARLIAEGELGAPGSVYVDFRRWANDADYEMNRHYQFSHPLLYDMAIHHYDLMRMVMGQEAVEVYAQDTSPSWSKFDEEAEAVLIVTFANGQILSYRGSWVSSGDPTHWAGEWRMEFSEGEMQWTSRAGDDIGAGGDLVQVRRRGARPVRVPMDDLPLLGRSMGLRQLVESIELGVEPESSGRRNLGTVAIMEAAVRSAESGKVEKVAQIADDR